MLRNGHVRFGGRVGETDRRQRRHRAPARPNLLIPLKGGAAQASFSSRRPTSPSAVVSAPAETVGWVARRFGRVLDVAARRAGRRLRVADEVERKAAEPLAPAAAVASAARVGLSADARLSGHVSSDGGAVDVPPASSGVVPSDESRASRDDQSTRKRPYRSAYPSSYPDVYTETKEVS